MAMNDGPSQEKCARSMRSHGGAGMDQACMRLPTRSIGPLLLCGAFLCPSVPLRGTNLPPAAVAAGCAVAPTPTGYQFSWLHVDTSGIIRDASGCTPLLEGYNVGGLDS